MAESLPPLATAQVDAKTKVDEKFEYSNLPCPVPYEELHLEAFMLLKPENFRGFTLRVYQGVAQSHVVNFSNSVMMGPNEVPSQSSQTIKIPTAHYEFGANYIDPTLMLIGRVMTDAEI